MSKSENTSVTRIKKRIPARGVDEALLEKVCNTPGVSGFETPVQAVTEEILKKCCDEVRRDRMGNVIGVKKAPISENERPLRILFAAHVDEIGMMVKHIDDNGFIRFLPIGGIWTSVAVSQIVDIHGRHPMRGVIVPPPDKEEKTGRLGEELYIDTGLPREKVLENVSVGDVMTFSRDFSLLNKDIYVGRNFDDRVGLYCLLEAMRRVGPTKADIYAAGSVQEEVGVRGAPALALSIEPDIGIAIDGSLAIDPYNPPPKNLCQPGEGTGIYLIDRLTIGHPGLVRFLLHLCEKKKIPVQKNIGGGTDASAMRGIAGGSFATTVGAPVRYMHSTVQLCHRKDIEATIDLLVAVMEHAHEWEEAKR